MAEARRRPAEVRAGPGAGTVEVRRRRRRYEGFFALDEVALSHPAFAGGRMDVVREVFVGTDAALVLPYDPRTTAWCCSSSSGRGRGCGATRRPWVLEPVAGLVDPGESPEDCARPRGGGGGGDRDPAAVPMPGGYASPGATTEHFHMFVGLCDLDPAMVGPGGLDARGRISARMSCRSTRRCELAGRAR
jgi:ADP-ribose pyrophosphatase